MELWYNNSVKIRNERRCIEMVNKTNKEQELKLIREIVDYELLDRVAYINGVRFDERKQADWVLAVLSNWNAKCIFNGGSDILKQLIHDAGMTYNLLTRR